MDFRGLLRCCHGQLGRRLHSRVLTVCLGGHVFEHPQEPYALQLPVERSEVAGITAPQGLARESFKISWR